MYGIRENCGVGVVYTVSDAVKIIEALRHRGPDTEGMARRNGTGIDVVRSYRDALSEHAYKSIFGGSGGFADTGFPIIVHTKYTTVGQKEPEKILFASHPHRIGGIDAVYNNHIVTRGARRAYAQNGQVKTKSMPYQVAFPTGCDTELLMYNDDFMGPEKLIRVIEDTYCSASLDEKNEFATVYRDRHGRMPLWLGRDKSGNFIAASEDWAIREIGGIPLREVKPGELLRLYKDKIESEQAVEPDPLTCFVQLNYMAKRDAYLLETLRNSGIDLKMLRSRLGIQTAKEIPPEPWVDFVTYIPNTPLDAAIAYAMHHKISFAELFYKSREFRSFMQPDQQERMRVIKSVLHVNDKITPSEFGENYIELDDSTIRGTNATVAREKSVEAGFRRVQHVSYSPQFGWIEDDVLLGCRHGVDIPPSDDFLRTRGSGSLEKMAEIIGIDSLGFLSIDGMLDVYESAGINRNNICLECVSSKARGTRPVAREHYMKAA